MGRGQPNFGIRLITQKWRRDEFKIREMMKLGYAVVVPSDQKFYLPIDMSEQTVSIEAAFRDKTKILILKGNG